MKFRYYVSDPSQNEYDSLPRLTFSLRCNNRQAEVVGLVDSGATVNVLPYEAGVRLGQIWDYRKANIRLSGNLGNFPAMPVVTVAKIGDSELKACKKIIKEITERKEKLVDEARNKIDSAEARQLILARWERTLYATVEEHLAQYSRVLRSSLENLREKYHQPLHSILKERDAASVELAGYLMELGYE